MPCASFTAPESSIPFPSRFKTTREEHCERAEPMQAAPVESRLLPETAQMAIRWQILSFENGHQSHPMMALVAVFRLRSCNSKLGSKQGKGTCFGTGNGLRLRLCSLQAALAAMTLKRDWPALGDRRVHRMSRLVMPRRAKHPKMISATESPMGHLAKMRDLSLLRCDC